MAFRLLTLGKNGAPSPAAETRSFAGRPAALAWSLWREQAGGRPAAYVFDLLGPARVQAYVPPSFRARYLIPLLGIEVWRPLSLDRRKALANATVKFAISRHTLDRALPFCPDLAGTAVLPLALEEREPEGAPDAAVLERAGEGFFLIVGRMAATERYKGHDQVLAALPPGARLVVAGDGDDRPRLEAKAAELGVADRVFFPGFVSEATLAELYRRSAALVMPSRGEGFGLVYLEAMRAGKPCVAARGSAAEEIVADGETGLLVDPDDARQLARSLKDLLGCPAGARRMGAAGQERWQREFRADRFRERLTPMLEELTA